MIRRLLLAAVVPVALVAGIAVASGGTPEDGRTVTVTLDEYTLVADRAAVPAGTIRFDTRNPGAIDHELLIVRTDLAPDALPMGLEGPAVTLAGDVVLGKPHRHNTGTSGLDRHVKPNGRLVEEVRLTPGDYVLLCSLPGHYAAGQRAALAVR